VIGSWLLRVPGVPFSGLRSFGCGGGRGRGRGSGGGGGGGWGWEKPIMESCTMNLVIAFLSL